MTTAAERARKLVYRFDEGDASMSDLLGGKGANLCEMARLELPIPPGFVIYHQSLPGLLCRKDRQFP